MDQRILSGSLWTVFGSGTGRILHLAAMIIAARQLGAVGFGGLSVVQSTLGLFGMFAGIALGATAIRFVAATHETDPVRTGNILGMVFLTGLLSGGIVGLALLLASSWLARVVIGAPELAVAVGLGSLLVALGVLRGVQDAALAGFQSFKPVAKLRIVEGLSSLALMGPLVSRFGPEGGIGALVIGLLIATLYGAHLVSRQLSASKIRIGWRNAPTEWRLLRDFSAPSLLASSVATPVLWLCIVLLTRSEDGLREVGLYNAAYQWHGPLIFIPMALTTVSLPVLVREWEAGAYKKFRLVFTRLIAAAALIALVPAVILSFAAGFIMSFYGQDYSGEVVVLVCLLFAAPVHVVSKLATSALEGMNKVWFLPPFHLGWGICIVTLSIWLIDDMGADGLAIAFLASYSMLAIAKVALALRLCPAASPIEKAPSHG